MRGSSASATRETRSVSRVLLAGIGLATLGIEAAEELADDLARRVGVERDAMRAAVHDTLQAWRAEAEKLGIRRDEAFERAYKKAGSCDARRWTTSRCASHSSSTGIRLLEHDPASRTSPEGRPSPQRSLGRATEIGRVATRHGFGYLLDRRRAADGEPDPTAGGGFGRCSTSSARRS